jgi:hypothetical protein
MDKIIFNFGFLLFGLSWLSYDHYRPWLNFHAEALAFLGIALSFWMLSWQQRAFIFSKRIVFFGTFLLLTALLQFATGVLYYFGELLIVGLFFMGFLLATSVGQQGATATANRTYSSFDRLCYLLCVVGFVSAVIGLGQWFGFAQDWGMYVVQTDRGERAMGNLGQANQLGILLVISVIACCYLFRVGKIHAVVLIAAVCVLSLGILLTLSRIAIVSIGALVCFGFLHWQQLNKRWLFASIGWLILMLFAGVMLPKINAAVNSMQQSQAAAPLKLQQPQVRTFADGESSHIRIQTFLQLADAVKKSPWVGYGWNRVNEAQLVGSGAAVLQKPYLYSHNIVVDLIVWLGIPLAVLIFLMVTAWFTNHLLRRKSDEACFAFMMLLVLAIYSMTEFPHAFGYFVVLAGLLTGVLESDAKASILSIRIKLYAFLLTAVIAATIGARMVFEYLQVERDFGLVRYQNLRIGITQTKGIVADTSNLYLLTQLRDMLDVANVRPSCEMTRHDIDKVQRISRLFLYGVFQERLIISLASNGQDEKARQEIATAVNLYGKSFDQTLDSYRINCVPK